ncbi:hypothetical protein QJS10_CPA05g02371 [Acorus calamus]|uniref:Transmembrane protein n=1 Tax=Acorus calamus TaxID=4465 RepID=A0AAV9EQI2_ACOCL|nr:hypothetical protein QJS10_CPA05g02371 [Acorus calamus]
MAMVSSKESFLINTPLKPTHPYKNQRKPIHLIRRPISLKRSSSMNDDDPKNNRDSSSGDDMRLAKLAIVTFAAGVLTIGSVHDSMAAKSGGRVGGQAFRSAAPRSSGPRINNSRTNIYINPPVAPPLIGGYGVPYYGGGWGWSPFSFFTPGPAVAIGYGGGFEFFAAFLLLGVVSSVIRRFTRRHDEDDDEDY